MTKPIRVLSFGAGVQSSALLLMCDRGDIEPVDFAVFADTKAEPLEVLAWLDKVRKAVSTPIVVASKGDIVADHVAHFAGTLKRVGQAPLYSLSPDGKKGMIRRHCTKEYKIEVVNRAIRDRLGYRPRQRWKHHIELLMGISADEQQRMKISTEAWRTNVYPLVDRGLKRHDCVEIVRRHGLGTPPRSACYFCPFKSNREWRLLRDEQPEEFQKAIEFDRKIRRSRSPGLTSEFFVHRSHTPLEFADLGDPPENQMSFMDECDGVCGV